MSAPIAGRVDVSWSRRGRTGVSCWATEALARRYAEGVDADDDRNEQQRRAWEFRACVHVTEQRR